MATKVSIVSLGCAKNQVDAEMLFYKIREAGYEISEDPGVCDVAIVNTCGFIESAKQESIDEILELSTLKREGQIKKIIVTGCLAERYNNDMMKEMCEIDAVVGTVQIMILLLFLIRLWGMRKFRFILISYLCH